MYQKSSILVAFTYFVNKSWQEILSAILFFLSPCGNLSCIVRWINIRSCSSLLEIKDKIYNSDMSMYSEIESCLLIWVISKRGHNSNSILDDFNIFFKRYWMSSAGNIVQHYIILRKVRWSLTLILPSWDPLASISESLLKAMHSTAASIIIKLS